MLLKIFIFWIFLLCPVFGAPVSQQELNNTDGLENCGDNLLCDKNKFQKCIEGKCQCEDPLKQIYDIDLQQCAYFVGSNCSEILPSVTEEEIASSTFSFVVVIQNEMKNNNKTTCVSNSECSFESLECECFQGYEKTENSTCKKIERTARNDISAEEEESENIENVPFGKHCESDEECDFSQGLNCTKFSINSTRSVCDCLNSTYIYTLEKGCFLPYGLTIREILLRKYAMRNYRRSERNLNFKPEKIVQQIINSTDPNSIGDRGQMQPEGIVSNNGNGNYQQPYQILDRNQYQPQVNPFGQFAQNYGNNFNQQAASKEQFSSANIFQGQQTQQQQQPQQQTNIQTPPATNNVQIQNSNQPANIQQNQFSTSNQNFANNNNNIPNNFPNNNNIPNNFPNNNNIPNNFPNINNNPINIQNNNNNPNNFGGYSPNSVSPQFPNPSYGQFQQPASQIRPNEPPRFSLLSLILNPLTQLLNPQQNSDGRTVPLSLPFMREKRGLIAFFARLLNTFLPVLRTLDYQLAPVLAELAKFRYFDNPNNNNNNNNGNFQQNPNNNQQQNTQGFGNTPNNPFSYQSNPFQYQG